MKNRIILFLCALCVPVLLLTACAGDAEEPGRAEADAETLTSASAFPGDDAADDTVVNNPTDNDAADNSPADNNPTDNSPAENSQPDNNLSDSVNDTETEAPAGEIPAEQTEVSPSAPYSHVAIIGVDGAGAFFRDADMPRLNEIFANGAVTYRCLTSDPTISAQCWGSLMTGVKPDCHRLSNSLVERTPYPVDSEFPTFFRVVREAMPDAALGSFCNWNPINVGIVEDNLGVTKGTASGDSGVTDMVCKYVKNELPTVLFVQFDEVDGAGHGSGYGTKQHLKQLHTTDTYIGKIYDTYRDCGILEDTLFIVTADHGGSGTSHGGLTDGEKYVMWAAVGKNVERGEIRDIEIRDTASVVLTALGLADRQPESWTARVPSGLFEGVEAAERPVYEIRYLYGHRTHEAVPTPDGLPDLFGADRVRAYLPFDGDIDPAAGDAETKDNGKLYYVDGFFGSAAQFDDGYVTLNNCTPDMNSFTVGMWMKTGGVGSDPCLFSNKDWNSGKNRGFVLSLRDTDVKFNLGDGSSRFDKEYILPLDFRDGWVYVLFAADREKGEVRFSYDFGPFITTPLSSELKNASFTGLKMLNIGQDGTGKYSAHLGAVLDEFILLDGAADEGDLEKLKTWYGD